MLVTNHSQSSPLQLNFDNRFVRSLPADPTTDNHRRQVLSACYSFVEPTIVSSPQLVAYSKEVAQQLDLSEQDCISEIFTQVFAGNKLLNGMQAHAQCYGGHQFGNWAGQLGDGRAINLGDAINQQGEHFTLQLKGAGETPYSRTADGLAVLRSSVREFLCSEAMFHLGIPTTRALSLVTTGDQVIRDMFYDGHPKSEPGAVVCRVAPSFLRFGSYEIFAARGDIDTLRTLVDFTITTHFSHLGEPSVEVYLKWFAEICESTADMIVHWMRVGFVHGVMNTDNMSILGLTIDYGPYGWLEDYDPDWTPNTTDAQDRRYRFGNQSQIAQWNLFQLANAIYPLIEQAEPLQKILNDYVDLYTQKWQVMRAQKLGLNAYTDSDQALHQQLHEILQLVETDMTIFYRKLADINTEHSDQSNEDLMAPLMDAYYDTDALSTDSINQICDWLRQYQSRVQQDNLSDDIRRHRMNKINPKYVLRNYMAQLAIDKAELGDNSLVNELLELLRRPYDEQPAMEHYAVKRPDWARDRAGCSMLSCSS
ncbi:MAG: YdiU family protein [Piscirickettsiaceae bacterium]|nr:YdiU family protein [Piscirickettsiaceae bacterium]